MKVGIISDIEGNHQRLERVLDELSREACDSIVNLGDSVGQKGDSDESDAESIPAHERDRPKSTKIHPKIGRRAAARPFRVGSS